MIEGFEDTAPNAPLGFHKFKCTTCGGIFNSGIANLSRHWSECGGKYFTKELFIRRVFKGKALTIEDVNEIKKQMK